MIFLSEISEKRQCCPIPRRSCCWVFQQFKLNFTQSSAPIKRAILFYGVYYVLIIFLHKSGGRTIIHIPETGNDTSGRRFTQKLIRHALNFAAIAGWLDCSGTSTQNNGIKIADIETHHILILPLLIVSKFDIRSITANHIYKCLIYWAVLSPISGDHYSDNI